MKKLTDKIKYVAGESTATLYAMPKYGKQRWTAFAECHLSTLNEIRKRGVFSCASLLRMLPSCPPNTAKSLQS